MGSKALGGERRRLFLQPTACASAVDALRFSEEVNYELPVAGSTTHVVHKHI